MNQRSHMPLVPRMNQRDPICRPTPTRFRPPLSIHNTATMPNEPTKSRAAKHANLSRSTLIPCTNAHPIHTKKHVILQFHAAYQFPIHALNSSHHGTNKIQSPPANSRNKIHVTGHAIPCRKRVPAPRKRTTLGSTPSSQMLAKSMPIP